MLDESSEPTKQSEFGQANKVNLTINQWNHAYEKMI